LVAIRLSHRHSQIPSTWLGVLCVIRSRRARREGVLARAEDVLRKGRLTRSAHASQE
jgi:hypothetical protein